MSKVTKIVLITAGSLIALGIVVSLIGIAVMRNSAKKRENTPVVYEHKEEVITEDFTKFDIAEISENVEIRPSADGQVTIDYYDAEDYMHNIEVSDDTLMIKVKTYDDDTPWWKRFTFSFDIEGLMSTVDNIEHPTVIYLPEDSYGSLSIFNVSGDVIVPENYSFDGVDVDTTSGEITIECAASGKVSINTISGGVTLSNINATSLDISTTSGDVRLTDGKVSGRSDISTVSGEIFLTRFETDDLNSDTVSGEVKLDSLTVNTAGITTTSGDVTGTVTGNHEFAVDTTSGDVSVEESLRGESLFKIDTVSGDVRIDKAA